MKNAIIFCNRKRDVATLHRSLLRHGFSVLALHGDMDQPARTAALEQFRKGEVTLLVASDVAARGLDIPDVSHIYNFDVPIHPDDYVHRIGRTGRAGRSGTAITIVAGVERRQGGRRDRKADRRRYSVHGQTAPCPRRPLRCTAAAGGRSAAASTAATAARAQRRHASRIGLPRQSRALRSGRRNRRKPRNEEADTSHLPAFLLRPVPRESLADTLRCDTALSRALRAFSLFTAPSSLSLRFRAFLDSPSCR